MTFQNAIQFHFVWHVDDKDKIINFIEKPKDPPSIPGNPNIALASMGIYVFETNYLFKLLQEDAATPGSSRDFGKDIIPKIVKGGKAMAHRFTAWAPNIAVKLPATSAGLDVLEECIAEGITITATVSSRPGTNSSTIISSERCHSARVSSSGGRLSPLRMI